MNSSKGNSRLSSVVYHANKLRFREHKRELAIIQVVLNWRFSKVIKIFQCLQIDLL